MLKKAMNTCDGVGASVSHHFRQTSVMMKVGNYDESRKKEGPRRLPNPSRPLTFEVATQPPKQPLARVSTPSSASSIAVLTTLRKINLATSLSCTSKANYLPTPAR